jgi:ribosomal protein S18 acetylase RimI-like enzyme
MSTTTTTTTTTLTLPSYASDEVRELGIEDCKAAADTLAEAFFKDDVAFYFLDTPDNGGKTRDELYPLHREILEYIVAAHCYNGLVLSIGENHEGVALWMPPGQNMDDWFTIFRSGMWRLWYKLTKEGKRRYFDEFMEILHRTKESVMGAQDSDTWYLVYVGVVPSARGRGYARKLIEYVTKKLDAEGGKPCYLESSHPRNVAMYQKLGFVKQRHIVLGPDCSNPAPLDIMVRPPMDRRRENYSSSRKMSVATGVGRVLSA